jgi:hypothetical protein
MEIGLYTFAETSADPATGQTVSSAQRLREVLEEIELADQVGLDVFGVGEHHRADFAASAPAVILAAGAERSKRIRLTSAVSVLSSDDLARLPGIRDAGFSLGGRARSWRTRVVHRSFFRCSTLDDYDVLFEQKLELLLKLREDEHDVVRHAPAGAERSGSVSPPASRSASRLGRRRRNAAVPHARGETRSASGDRDHRWGA